MYPSRDPVTGNMPISMNSLGHGPLYIHIRLPKGSKPKTATQYEGSGQRVPTLEPIPCERDGLIMNWACGITDVLPLEGFFGFLF